MKSDAGMELLDSVIELLAIIALDIVIAVNVESSLRFLTNTLFYVYVTKLSEMYVCHVEFNNVSMLFFKPNGSGIVNLSV